MFRARKLCPGGIFLRGRMARYREVSEEIMAVLDRFSPLVEKASVDEAYLDASGLTLLFGPVETMAKTLKEEVKTATGLTCSIGLAPVKFLAKIASDMQKPDGLTVLRPDMIPAFLQRLPVERIPGVGGKTLSTLHALGVRCAADVPRYPRDFWLRRLGKAGGVLYDRGRGIDPRPVVPWQEPKSESAENTFAEDTNDREVLRNWLLQQAERVGASLRRQALAGRTITLKVKYADFRSATRSLTMASPTNATRVIYETAASLLEELNPTAKLRLIGVGVSHFGPGRKSERQLSLLPEDAEQPEKARHAGAARDPGARAGTPGADPGRIRDKARDQALDAAIDAVRERFGKDALVRGRFFADNDT